MDPIKVPELDSAGWFGQEAHLACAGAQVNDEALAIAGLIWLHHRDQHVITSSLNPTSWVLRDFYFAREAMRAVHTNFYTLKLL